MPPTQTLLHSLRALRNHAIRQDTHHFIPQFFILSGSGQNFLTTFLTQADRMKLILTHVPPSGYDGVGQKARHQLSPDQSLHISWREEILLCRSKNVW